MADIRIKDLPTTATQTASDDFIALDGTVNGTRKIDASAPSFKTSVTSPSVVAPASTPLTLTGGSTGASLVLGATSNGVATLKSLGTGRTVISSALGATTPTVAIYNDTTNTRTTLGIIGNGGSSQAVLQFGFGAAASPTLTSNIFTNTTDFQFNAVAGSNIAFVVGATEAARFAPTTGNLLIGTTTDAANLSGGLVVNGSGTAAAASSTTTGALRVTGGVGVSGAGYFGGNLSVSSGVYTFTGTTVGLAAQNWMGSNSAGGLSLNVPTGNAAAFSVNNVASLTASSSSVNVPLTTSASSSISGALTIGNGTAATNVAIGGGSMIAGANVQAVGNINVGVVGSDFNAGRVNIVAGSDTVPGLSFGGSNYGFGILEKTDGNLYFARRTGSATNTTWLSVGRDTGAAAFAGAVTVSPTALTGVGQIASAFTPTYTSAATANGRAIYARSATAAAAFTLSDAYTIYIDDTVKGAGSTIANNVALKINNQTAGTNNYAIQTGTGIVNFTDSTPSTGSTSGALQVAGGIYAGAASVFGSTLASGITTGGGGLTVTSTAENRVVLRSFQDAPVGILFQSNTQATGHYNWLVGSQQLTNQAFEIVPSTAINGTTFTTAAMRIDGATSAATFAGVVIKKNYTVATLPAAASYTYGEAYVSDATQAAGTSLGSAPTGGGSVKRGVYSDGSSWLLR